jgi:nucleoside-diphosphate-sugar epimerase
VNVTIKVSGRNLRPGTILLRYFTGFGPRQDQYSQYGVMPNLVTGILSDSSPIIYGDDLQSSDFTIVKRFVQANVRQCESEETGARAGRHSIGYLISLSFTTRTRHYSIET